MKLELSMKEIRLIQSVLKWRVFKELTVAIGANIKPREVTTSERMYRVEKLNDVCYKLEDQIRGNR
jgi:hypothetical protein